MKVLRSTEWKPLFWSPSFPGMEGPVYLFLNERYSDVIALKVAKFIDVTADDVFIYDASNRTISLKYESTVESETSLPVVKFAMG